MGVRMKDINCFKEKEPSHAGLELLTQWIKLVSESEDKPSVPHNDETADAVPPHEMKVDEDQKGDSDIDID